jgi:hypothetical protein
MFDCIAVKMEQYDFSKTLVNITRRREVTASKTILNVIKDFI